MSDYNMECFLSDFADRTMSNLEIVEHCKENGNDKAYEVTQLINSLFGLIILPVETYKVKGKDFPIHNAKIEEESKFCYDKVQNILKTCLDEKRMFNNYEKNKNEKNGDYFIDKFVTHLRNAIAHSGQNGIHFYPISEGGEITEVIFYDNDKCKVRGKGEKIHEFCIKLTIEELNELTKAIKILCFTFENKYGDADKKISVYNMNVEKLNGLLAEGNNTGEPIFDFKEKKTK